MVAWALKQNVSQTGVALTEKCMQCLKAPPGWTNQRETHMFSLCTQMRVLIQATDSPTRTRQEFTPVFAIG